MRHAIDYIAGICSASLFTVPRFPGRNQEMLTLVVLILGFLLVEWIGREGNYAIERIGLRWSRPARWSFYLLLVFLIILFLPLKESPFIYFQF
jgi:hypothetical protein